MDNKWETLTQIFRECLSHPNYALTYGLGRLLHAIGQQLKHCPYAIPTQAIILFFQEIQKPLIKNYLTLSKHAQDEKTRIELSNFLYQIYQGIEVDLPDIDLNLGEGYKYHLHDSWETISNLEAEDISYLFGALGQKAMSMGKISNKKLIKTKKITMIRKELHLY